MNSYWKKRSVFVTGGHGFLGKHLVSALENEGTFVYNPSHVHCDLCFQDDVRRAIAYTVKFGGWPITIFHLAARVTGIGAIAEKPVRMFYDNLVMGLNILEVAAQHMDIVEKVVIAGSVCAYPKHLPMPMIEENLWNGFPEETNGYYGVAKRTLSTAVLAYHGQHKLNANYLLTTNLYGPGSDFDPHTSHVIPALIRKMVEAKEGGQQLVHVWGTGKASRDFLYVDDAVRAYLLAAEKLDTPEPINVGGGVEIPIYALAHEIKRIVGYEGELVWDTSKPDGQPRRSLRGDKIHAALGWKATTSLQDGLHKTYEWWMENRNGGK